jgi:NADPH:quinone reductase-like Zn-dependent oxidoreductase
MKAIYIDDYGGPEAMRYGDRPDPTPGPRDLLVRVKAASINPIDWKMRQGILRAAFALKFPYVLGRDMSGVVVVAGAEVTGIKPGDEVFGVADALRGGTHAEQFVTDAELVAKKPRSLGHREAGAVPLAAVTALIALEETAALAKGERILIHGGAGGVGAAAVQIAKARACWVAATCAAKNRDFVRSLGADQAIDYAGEDFGALLHDLDVVLDTMGGEVHRRSRAVLKPGGRLVHIAAAPIPEGEAGRGITVTRAEIRGRRPHFERIAALIDSGALKAFVGAVLPLAEAAKGYEMNRANAVRGKIVLEPAA